MRGSFPLQQVLGVRILVTTLKTHVHGYSGPVHGVLLHDVAGIEKDFFSNDCPNGFESGINTCRDSSCGSWELEYEFPHSTLAPLD